MDKKMTVGKIEQLTTDDKSLSVEDCSKFKLKEILPQFTIDEIDRIAKYTNAAKKLVFQEKEWDMNHEITSGDVSLIIKAIESVAREKEGY